MKTTSEVTLVNVKKRKGARFIIIMVSLCLVLFLSALEIASVAMALPTIVAELHGSSFVWVGSGYALASCAILPLMGGIAQIFGRRPAVIVSVVVFAVGSAIAGAAKSMSILILGRVIQGVGGGGIQALCNIVLGDLVSLEERGLYAGLFGLVWSFAAAIGPLVGAALSTPHLWRWLFYLNLPICAVTLVMVMTSLNLPTPPGTLKEKLSKVDWIGNTIVMGSTCAITIAVSMGGVNFPWGSPRILVPLIIGIMGLGVFLLYEARYAKHPLVPIYIMSNLTSLSGYIQSFLTPVTSLAAIYYIPVYFQACKDTSVLMAGVHMLGLSSIGFAALVGGVSVKVLQRYRPQLWLGWVLMVVGMGLLIMVKLDTPVPRIIGFCIIYGLGAGIIYAAGYYPILAPLPVSANAYALSFHAFLRQFAGIWGVTLGGAILQNELAMRLPQEFLAEFPQGVAIIYSAIPIIPNLPEPLKTVVRQAFVESINKIYIVLVAICGVGFASSLLMKGIPLHSYTDDEWAPKDLQEKDIKGLTYVSIDTI